MPSPLDLLGVLARQEVTMSDEITHTEMFTMKGLLTVLAHGSSEAPEAVVLCGGAMGGLLGPADGLYHDLGETLADQGVQSLRVDYRQPNDLSACVLDVCAVAEMAGSGGAERFVAIGHSFGGAVAINAALSLPAFVVGVATLSTQSAGCERVAELSPRPLRLYHGDSDQILPAAASETVQRLAGPNAQLTLLEGADHLLTVAGSQLRTELVDWITATLRSR